MSIRNRSKTVLPACAAAFFVLLAAAPTAVAQGIVSVEAIAGEPFGVGRIVVRTPPQGAVLDLRPRGGQRVGRILDLARELVDRAAEPTTADYTSLRLVEASNRTFYPAYDASLADRILRGVIPIPGEASVYFLFQGGEPLRLTLYAPQPYPATVTPKSDARAHRQLLQAWWNEFSAGARQRAGISEHPPVVDVYLTAMLPPRLGLPAANADDEPATPARSALGVLLGTEAARVAVEKQILRGTAAELEPVADQPLPEPIPEPLAATPVAPSGEGAAPTSQTPRQEIAIEPIAMRVPEECLYLRFGTFSNFLWMRHRIEEWGGEIRDLVTQRGLDLNLNERVQQQLVLRESALAELLGPTVIADVALIGTDSFLREGASIGVLFQARSNTALAADILGQRQTALKAVPGIIEEQVLVGKHKVSYLYTPDNRVRSYYAVDGDFHLVTTSRYLVERFLETAKGHRVLGALANFRDARLRLPAEADDTVFIYLSEPFFRNLLAPHYQIEMQRRWRSSAEIELFELARLAAAGEGEPVDTVAALVDRGFLPAGFGRRADGSQLVVVEGELQDSLRGARGTFAPVADMTVTQVTAAEAESYRRFAEDFGEEWQQVDPVLARVRRKPAGKSFEHISLDLQAAPLGHQHYDQLAAWIGPASDQRLRAVTGDLVSGQLSMRGRSRRDGNASDYVLLGGLRDADPARAMNEPRPSLVQRLLWEFQFIHGYVGAWPHPGILRMIGAASERRPDQAGYTRLLSGLWRRQFDDFTVLSFHPTLLAEITPQVAFEQAPRPAQLWLRLRDLQGTQLAGVINAYGYRHARRTSLGNSELLNQLVEQLHVPPAQATMAAEQILDAKLVSPLGGGYTVQNVAGGPPTLVASSPLASPDIPLDRPPRDYRFPALSWLRGGEVEGQLQEGLVALHADLVLTTPEASKAASTKKPASSTPAPSARGSTTPKAPRPTPPAAPSKKPAPAPLPEALPPPLELRPAR